MAGDDNELFMTKSQRYAEDSRRAHLISRIDKSIAYVTNNLKDSALLNVFYYWS